MKAFFGAVSYRRSCSEFSCWDLSRFAHDTNLFYEFDLSFPLFWEYGGYLWGSLLLERI